jgi:NAD(P)-dependent dehydrogenase (short-subunit alcohol dehydrogenase family)
MRYAVDHITATGAVLEDTARALRAAGMSAARTLPIAGRVFGAAPRLELDGRVVFVTGAARGIGAEVARQAHARGARVALVGRRLEPLQQLAAQLGEGAAAFQADVRDLDALQRAADATVARFGGIDVVIANAGIAPPSEPILTIDPGEFERTVDIDLLGQWRTVRATLPAVIERRGHILVVASIYAFVNGALNASYAASKAGVEQLTRALRVELAHHGATAGVAYLGFVDTDLVGDVFTQQQIVEARSIAPSFVTRPIPVTKAGRTLVDGIESRAATVAAPGWIRPLLPLRGLAGTLMDEFMLANPGLSRAISRAERKANEQ